MSRWFVGSSSSRTSGSRTSDLASKTRRFMPEESDSNGGVGIELHPREDLVDRVIRRGSLARPSSSSPAATSSKTEPPRPSGTSCGSRAIRTPLRADDLAVVGLEVAVEQPHQRRLARPVPADQPDPLAALDLPVDLVQERGAAERHADPSHAHQRHEPTPLGPKRTPRHRRPDLRGDRHSSSVQSNAPAPPRQLRGWHRSCKLSP